MSRLTRKGFEEWLRAKPGNEEVGLTQNPCRCPIASYLGRNGHWASVGLESYEVRESKVPNGRNHGKDFEGDLPKWAQTFIRLIDRSEISPYSPSAYQCLYYLSKVP